MARAKSFLARISSASSFRCVPWPPASCRQGVQPDEFHAYGILGLRQFLLGLEHLHIRLHRFELRAFARSDARSDNTRYFLNSLKVLLEKVYCPLCQQQLVE